MRKQLKDFPVNCAMLLIDLNHQSWCRVQDNEGVSRAIHGRLIGFPRNACILGAAISAQLHLNPFTIPTDKSHEEEFLTRERVS